MSVPDPNGFGGNPRIKTKSADWEDVPVTFGYNDGSRGIGAADIAYAFQTGRPHRTNGDLAYHVLETMEAFHTASDAGSYYQMTSTVERPAPLNPDLPEGTLDE